MCDVDTATKLTKQIPEFQSVVSSWIKYQDSLPHQALVFVLRDVYPRIHLSHNGLKGQDYHIVSQLSKVCQSLGLYVYLGTLTGNVKGTREVSNNEGDEDEYEDEDCCGYYAHRHFDHDSDNEGDAKIHDMDEITNVTHKLHDIVALDGKEISDGLSIPLDEETIIQKNFFDDDEPDEETADDDEIPGHIIHSFRRTVSTPYLMFVFL